METLKEELKKFYFKGKDVDELSKKFAKLAPYFISGGYIKVREDYRVYPTTVEFYFHSEKDEGVHDPIVYHRNNKHVQGEIPFFPMFTLHAHDSGYDITFENSSEKYRASVLIRAYQVWDVKQSCWLKWGKNPRTENSQFLPYEGKDPINTQVLYLKYILNGFTMGSGNLIDWIDATERLKPFEIDNKHRQNVPLYIQNPVNKTEKIEFEIITEEFYNNKENKNEFARQYENEPYNKIHISQPEYFTYNKVRCLKDFKPWSFSRKKPIL